jgi:hypothetical protein
MRRELAFARKLPDGDRVRRWAEDALAIAASSWTDAAFHDLEHGGRIQVLRHLQHTWIARLALAVHRWRSRRADRGERQ